MARVKGTGLVSRDLQAQRDYVQRMEALGGEMTLIVPDAFIRSIRDIGYKSTGYAINELVDNAIQAESKNVYVAFRDDESSGGRPVAIAVIDDGHGMDPEMIPHAMRWGGGHREKDRTGFGRYGFGLKSAAVSQGRRFTIFSKVEDNGWFCATLDLDMIADQVGDPAHGSIRVPMAEYGEPPRWVLEYIDKYGSGEGLSHGTVVLIEKLDRLSSGWRTPASLERNLLQHFGVIYRNYLRDVTLWVNDKKVEAVDPLFLTDGARFYDVGGSRAIGLPDLIIEVPLSEGTGTAGRIRVRFSYLPLSFGPGFNPGNNDTERKLIKARFSIMKEHNGIIVLRHRRQLDVLTRIPWTSLQNNDRFWKVELDFEPELDEEFSVTTSKQQVVLSERIWEILKKEGVLWNIKKMRERHAQEVAEWHGEQGVNPYEKRPSERAMEETEKFLPTRPSGSTAESDRRGQERLEKEAENVARETGRPVDDVKRGLEETAKSRPFKVEFEDNEGAPFFRPDQIGGQKQLYINKAHAFYTDIYAGSDSTPHLRSALETLLFAIAEAELASVGDRRTFYKQERIAWSQRLEPALERLEEIDSKNDLTQLHGEMRESAEGEVAQDLLFTEA